MTSNLENEWRLNSFFSGIGGFELAFERSGFSTNFYCENDPFCRSVLKRHWPDADNASDIVKLDPTSVPDATLWTAGFPCQDLSLAKVPHGRTGFRGSKSSLFFIFHELLRIHRPRVVLLENVAGLLNSHKGADFQTLLESLTELGYAVSWRLLNARYFGVPQSRPRVFICAWMDSPEKAVSSLFENLMAPKPKRERDGFITPSYCAVTGAVVPHISYCISATSARHTGLDWARSYVTYKDGVRRLTPLECERIQGFPDHWSVPSDDWVTSIEGLDTERYRALGNAIAVPVVEWIAGRIRLNLTGQLSQDSLSSSQLPAVTADSLRGLTAEFARPSTRVDMLRGEHKIKWQRGGCAFRYVVVHTPASTTPVQPTHSQFVDLLENRPVNPRYYLSPNAARGIIRRVDRAKRRLFPPLDASLRALASGTTARTPQYEDKLTCQEAVHP